MAQRSYYDNDNNVKLPAPIKDEQKEKTPAQLRLEASQRRFAIKTQDKIIWKPTWIGARLDGIKETITMDNDIVDNYGEKALFYEESEYDGEAWIVFTLLIKTTQFKSCFNIKCPLENLIMMCHKYNISDPNFYNITPVILMSLEISDFTKVPNQCEAFDKFLGFIVQFRTKVNLLLMTAERITGYWGRVFLEKILSNTRNFNLALETPREVLIKNKYITEEETNDRPKKKYRGDDGSEE